MVKILGIVGSPEKRNTYALVKEALKAADKVEHVKVELIHLSNLNIDHCRGCGSCKQTLRCRIDDDMQMLYPKLAEADAIIIGTPTYFWNVSGLLKDFIDRSRPILATKALKGKICVAIITTSTTGQGQALSAVTTFFQQHEMYNAGNITIALKRGYLHGKEILDTNALKMGRTLGERVVYILTDRGPKSSKS